MQARAEASSAASSSYALSDSARDECLKTHKLTSGGASPIGQVTIQEWSVTQKPWRCRQPRRGVATRDL